MKIYTLAINECGKDEFLKDLKGLTGGMESPGGSNAIPGIGNFNWYSMMTWIRRMAGLFGVKKIDDSKIIANDIHKPINLACNAHFAIIGQVNDTRNKDNVEQV